MAADGTIAFETKLDNAQLEKDMAQVRKDISELERQISKKSAERSFIERQMDEGERSIRRVEATITDLQKRASEAFKDVSPRDHEAWVEASERVAGYNARIAEARSEIDGLIAKQDGLNDKWQAADQGVAQHNALLKAANARSTELGSHYAKLQAKIREAAAQTAALGDEAAMAGENAEAAATGASTALSGGMAEASARMDAIQHKINGMIKRVFLLSVATMGLRALRSMFADALMGNAQLEAAVNGLKATFSGLVNYVAGVVAPVLVGMANAAAAAIRALASVVDSIFGTNITASIAAAQRAVSATKAATKATKQQTKATKQLAKEQRSLMSFDELHRLDDNSDSGDSSNPATAGGGGGTGAGGFDVGQISDKLAEIMLILGAAIMAVGAILAFSGINIPLGITLMMVGALMVYTAYRERWDELPAKVRDAITTALVVTGIVLFVVGAVIAFSAANVPLGIGMMVAGALLLWTAVAINWDGMTEKMRSVVTIMMGILSVAALVVGAIIAFAVPTKMALGIALMIIGAASLAVLVALNWNAMTDKVKNVVSAIMLVLSAALLVVGAVIAFSSPAKAPLGIALMAAGAAGLAAVVALNWNRLSDKVKAVVTALTLVLGVAFLVVGAILAFSSTNIPLGIALMAIGAAALAAAVAISWTQLPDKVKETISKIAAIVGTALLVLGVILVATGHFPLGIALIIAGVGSLVAAAAINWDWLLDKIKGVWSEITNWFDSTVKPIFSPSWWGNLFAVIPNAFNSVINSITSAFSGLISGISSSIGGLLSRVIGIGSSARSVTSRAYASSYGAGSYYRASSYRMTSIPRLAEGSVIPPNREFMAVLGDQRRGNNIETPEGLMRQVVREEAGAMMAQLLLQMTAQQDQGGGDAVMMLNVDGETLAVAVENGRAKAMRRGLISPELSVV